MNGYGSHLDNEPLRVTRALILWLPVFILVGLGHRLGETIRRGSTFSGAFEALSLKSCEHFTTHALCDLKEGFKLSEPWFPSVQNRDVDTSQAYC